MMDEWIKEAKELFHDLIVSALEDGMCGKASGSHPATDHDEEKLLAHIEKLRAL